MAFRNPRHDEGGGGDGGFGGAAHRVFQKKPFQIHPGQRAQRMQKDRRPQFPGRRPKRFQAGPIQPLSGHRGGYLGPFHPQLPHRLPQDGGGRIGGLQGRGGQGAQPDGMPGGFLCQTPVVGPGVFRPRLRLQFIGGQVDPPRHQLMVHPHPLHGPQTGRQVRQFREGLPGGNSPGQQQPPVPRTKTNPNFGSVFPQPFQKSGGDAVGVHIDFHAPKRNRKARPLSAIVCAERV